MWLFLSTPQKKMPVHCRYPYHKTCVTGSYDQIPSKQSPYLLLGEEKLLFKSCQKDSQVEWRLVLSDQTLMDPQVSSQVHEGRKGVYTQYHYVI